MAREVITLECTEAKAEGKPVSRYLSSRNKKTAAELDIPLLGKIPLDPSIREAGDAGSPISGSKPDFPSAHAFDLIATEIISRLSG